MNVYELRLYIMVWLHIFIWIFTLSAWAFGLQKIALYLLVFIFIFQCLPFHGLVKAKLEFVEKNKQHLKKIENFSTSKRAKCTYDYYAKALNMPIDEVKELFSYLRYYELSTGILAVKKRLYDYFEENSFENPLSSQGMIIISFILNALIK
jgi:hypothetical protein